MGISGGSDGGIACDCSAGAIVWVRRRNGSWWPGRILRAEELAEFPIMSPRSGTPVKLLGRDDASVDWYNLEKSKRVKAFRCGEFDACIERAEASQGITIKKREKYARREDAILHALELEKKHLEMKRQNPGIIANYRSNKTSGRYFSNCSSDIYMRNAEPGSHSKLANNKSQMFSRKAPSSLQEQYKDDHFNDHKSRDGKQFSREKDVLEAVPRTRGLQDLGLRIPSQRKLSQSLAWDGSQKPAHNHVDDLSSFGHSMRDAGRAVSSKNVLAVKRKSSQSGMNNDSPVKKRDRRRPLVQVLQSTAKVPSSLSFQPDCCVGIIPVQGENDLMGVTYHAKKSKSNSLLADPNVSLDHLGYSSKEMPTTETLFGMDKFHQHLGSLAEEFTPSGSIETTESDSYEMDYMEPDTEDEEQMLTDTTHQLVKQSERHIGCDPAAFHVPVKFGYINSEEMPPSCIPGMHSREQTADASSEMGMSRWHMKGRRNIRNLAKRTPDSMDRKISKTADKHNQRASGRGLNHIKVEYNYACDEGDYIDKDMGHTQLIVLENQRYSLALKAAKVQGRSHSTFMNSDDYPYESTPLDWEVPEECFKPLYAPHLSDEIVPMLIDVDLKVQASYQGERVPLVSLMSRLNGKAIIGHPVQIEILEDGSSALVVSRDEATLDGSTPPPQIWRTARRTAVQRLPCSNPVSSALEGDDAVKSCSDHFHHETQLAKKSTRRFQRKILKRVSLSNQKTRTLSSLSTEQKRSCEMGALIKPEGGVPRVTCLPVKVVFSRILEAVGRP